MQTGTLDIDPARVMFADHIDHRHTQLTRRIARLLDLEGVRCEGSGVRGQGSRGETRRRNVDLGGVDLGVGVRDWVMTTGW